MQKNSRCGAWPAREIRSDDALAGPLSDRMRKRILRGGKDHENDLAAQRRLTNSLTCRLS